MNADTLYKEGRLSEAVDAQIQYIKANPGDQNQRLFLFELLAFAGDIERARRQIQAVQYGEPELDFAVAGYGKLLDVEESRRRLFSAGLAPKFLSDPPEHVRLRLEAVNRLRENRPAEAHEVLNKANEIAPVLKGTLNGKPFETFRDWDDLFAHVLEIVAQSTYYWVPLEEIESLTVKAPRFPRDLLWLQGTLTVRSGAAGDVFLPNLYPNSHEHADNQAKLGRMTDLRGAEGGPVLGVGARMFAADEEGVALTEVRELKMTVSG